MKKFFVDNRESTFGRTTTIVSGIIITLVDVGAWWWVRGWTETQLSENLVGLRITNFLLLFNALAVAFTIWLRTKMTSLVIEPEEIIIQSRGEEDIHVPKVVISFIYIHTEEERQLADTKEGTFVGKITINRTDRLVHSYAFSYTSRAELINALREAGYTLQLSDPDSLKSLWWTGGKVYTYCCWVLLVLIVIAIIVLTFFGLPRR